MTKLALVFVAALLVAGSALAGERIDLTVRDQVNPGTMRYEIVRLDLNWANSFIYVTLEGQNGEQKSISYDGADAAALMIALNKVDLSVKSLHRRILERLIADGHLAGSISGAPD